jgi:AcrR family transcriptional regulator
VETKHRIVREAFQLFLERGYEGTSLQDIAARVGITKPAIYYHFDGKDQLFHAVVSLFFERMGEWSASQFRGCDTAHALLSALLSSIGSFKGAADILLDREPSDTAYNLIELFLAAGRRDPAIRGRIGAGFVESRRRLSAKLEEAQDAGEIRDDVDCDAVALLIHAAIEGTTLISYHDETVDVQEVGGPMFDLVWRLLSRER